MIRKMFVTIDASKLKLEVHDMFCFVDQDRLVKELEKHDILEKVISEYKEERFRQ